MQIGRFITIEGGEGVGKSTQIEAVRATIASAGYVVVTTREPGGTERAERIRDLLLTPTAEAMPLACELLLMFAARSTHLENVIRPALEQGRWVICDRFTDASYAYQGGGCGVPHEQIAFLERFVQGDLRPDLTLLLDAPIELAMARARRRNSDRGERLGDRFEREQNAFFDKVRAAYVTIARDEPERIKVIDAAQPIEQVRFAVEEIVTNFIRQVRR